MDPHPETDLDAPLSNPDEEEDRPDDHYESGEEPEDDEEEEEDLENEDPSGVNPPPPPSLPPLLASELAAADYYRRSQEQQVEERKRLERELLAQKEAQLQLKREESPYGANNGHSSKSTTPSPASPPQTQYLYAANHPFAAFLSPAHLAAAAAAAQAAAQQGAAPPAPAPAASPPGGDDQSKYTFEEQFKQLYELSPDPQRKEFLDDLFNYMQKRGTPVNRIPIMAKQVLDLYELYRLVVTRGGLVEVINKKIWREIVKGLNLPSSITSAAFTLRTQYMKYLYAYECHREKLSTAEELQAAIDGNRREGRRSSYGPYGDMVGQGMVPASKNSSHPQMSSPLSLVSRHVNGHGAPPGGRGSSSPLPLHYYTHNNNNSAPLPLNLAPQENGLYGSQGLSSGEDDNCNSISSLPNPMVLPQQEALNLEVSRNSSHVDQKPNIDHKPLNMKRKNHEEEDSLVSGKHRLRLSEEERLLSRSTMPSTHIKIASNRGPDGRTQSDGSLMVSMEVNGIMYQGVLFAAPSHRNRL